jgi:hypothetical protein
MYRETEVAFTLAAMEPFLQADAGFDGISS